MIRELVSIIIPVYNVAPYLDKCVRSAVEQTYQNLEIILVDDGSNDRSPEICDKWAKLDHRIKVIHKKNGGVSSARNAGLDVAEGKYLSFLDGDDEYVSNTVEMSLNHYNETVDLVSFGYTIIYPDKGEKIQFSEKTYLNLTAADRFNFISGPFFKHETGWSVCCSVFLKSIIDKYSIKFLEGTRMAEDKIFSLCYCSHCSRISVIGQSLYHYYMRQDSVTHISENEQIHYFGNKNEMSKSVLKHFENYADTQYFVQNYPIIHYLIFEDAIKKEEQKVKFSALREKILNDIEENSDSVFFLKQLEGFKTKTKKLKNNYSFIQILEKKARVKWLLRGYSFWYIVLVVIMRRLK